MTDRARKPRAVPVAAKSRRKSTEPPAAATRAPRAAPLTAQLEREPDDLANGLTETLDPPPAAPAPPARFPLMAIFLAALAGLLSLALAVFVDNLIRTLFERHIWLGWTATALAGLLILALLACGLRYP